MTGSLSVAVFMYVWQPGEQTTSLYLGSAVILEFSGRCAPLLDRSHDLPDLYAHEKGAEKVKTYSLSHHGTTFILSA